MAFNGTGTFSLVAGNPVVTGTVISSTVHNNTMSDIANNGLSNCITKDGQTTITQNIPFNNKRITGLASATLTTDAARVDQVQNGSFTNLSTVSGSNTITASVSPVPAAYVEGQTFVFEIATTNTDATTLNISSLGAKDLYYGGSAMAGGELIAGNIAAVRYNGTQFDLIYQSGKPTAAEIVNSLSITSTDGSANLTITSSDDGATANPIINLVRESATPAADDLLGIVNAKGKNDADEDITYGSLGFEISDPADGAETAKAYFTVIESGTPVKTYLGARVTQSDVRQTVNTGPVDANGRADFVDAGTGLQAVTTGLTTTPLNVTAGDGFGASGKVDWVLEISEDLEWNGLVDNDVNYLAIDLSDGSTLSTILEPDYSPVKPSSPATGQIWYPLRDHRNRAEQWNGSVWVPKLLVVVGQVTTAGGVVTDAVSYAYQGKADTTEVTTWGNSTVISGTHNIGAPCQAEILFRCTSAVSVDIAYEVDDTISTPWSYQGSSLGSATSVRSGRIIAAARGGNTGGFYVGGATAVPIPTANFNVFFRVKRIS